MTVLILTFILSQWVAGECAPVGAIIRDGETWQKFADDPHQWAHLKNGKQIGVYNSKMEEYRTYDGKDWGQAQPPPWLDKGPEVKFEQIPDKNNHGLTLSKIGNGTSPRYMFGEKKSCRSEVMDALEGGLIDDSHRLWVCVIGDKSDRSKVFSDLATAKELVEFRGNLLVQAYSPEEWAVADYGFKTDGKPTIYIQSPDGKVQSRSDVYRGPAQLAMALRKAHKEYDPKKDPDLTKPVEPKPIPEPVKPVARSANYVFPLLIFLAMAGVFLVLKRREDRASTSRLRTGGRRRDRCSDDPAGLM